jgi:hypothetical protein
MPATDSKAATIFANRGQVTAALQRAADRARLIAEQTGTKLVVHIPAQTPNVTVNSVKTVGNVANED